MLIIFSKTFFGIYKCIIKTILSEFKCIRFICIVINIICCKNKTLFISSFYLLIVYSFTHTHTHTYAYVCVYKWIYSCIHIFIYYSKIVYMTRSIDEKYYDLHTLLKNCIYNILARIAFSFYHNYRRNRYHVVNYFARILYAKNHWR